MERIPILGCEDECWFDENFLELKEASTFFDKLSIETDWIQPQIRMFGKWVDQPRLIAWQSSEGLSYSYSGITLTASPYSDLVEAIARKIEIKTGLTFNSVLINFYRDGKDSMGWHADNEPELGENPMIASLSLGSARDFVLKHNQRSDLKKVFSLNSGSLLLMGKGIQKNWKHALPKRAHAGPRINLTFRRILVEE
jgi:alkylated DNA repair dioxygenase AlkB